LSASFFSDFVQKVFSFLQNGCLKSIFETIFLAECGIPRENSNVFAHKMRGRRINRNRVLRRFCAAPKMQKGGVSMRRGNKLPPGEWAAALAALAVLLVIACQAREVTLLLGGIVAGPLPAAQTAWSVALQRQSNATTPDETTSSAQETPDAVLSEETQTEFATDMAAGYEYPLLSDSERPDDAGTVIEKNYPQGSGDKYIQCGTGSIKNNTSVSAAEIAAEITNPLPFTVEQNSSEPQVLIMHTHATETYRLSAGLWFSPTDTSRNTDRSVNMCAVGAVITDTLNAAGIYTLHDETLNDYPSYTGSYSNSRAVVQQYLEQYPSIKVVLDVHRDAIESESGARYAPVCTVAGKQAAQVMIICGCDNGTTVTLPNWRQNLRFAAAWETAMEGMYTGFTRPVLFSYRFYNQDLTTGSLLIEIGGHGNNLNEALYAGELAAKGLIQALLGE
jgi:stage II sporulation protein P